ncbi:hypothetical protein ACET3Z_029136 [Daucus carota]
MKSNRFENIKSVRQLEAEANIYQVLGHIGSKHPPLTYQFSPSSMKPASTRHERIPNIHHFQISSHFPSIGLSATAQKMAATIKNQSSMTSHSAMNSSSEGPVN